MAEPDYIGNLINWFIWTIISQIAFPVGAIFNLLGQWYWFYDFMIGLDMLPPLAKGPAQLTLN